MSIKQESPRRQVPRLFGKLTDQITDIAESVVISNLLYRVDLSGQRSQIAARIMRKYFKRVPYQKYETEKDHRGRPVADWEIADIDGEFFDFIKFRGTIICLHIKVKIMESEERGFFPRKSFELITHRTKHAMKNLHAFRKRLIDESTDFWNNRPNNSIDVLVGGNYGHNSPMSRQRPYRTFNDVFIPQKQQDLLINTIQNFINKESWYRDHRIPYHFGILLHGNPGTGKSSVIQALINQWACDVTYIKPSQMKDEFDPASRNLWMFENANRLKFIIVEDVDTSTFTLSRDIAPTEDNSDNKPSPQEILGQVMNFMDGMTSPRNVIYIFTTNHLDRLDPALIRPGRIDLITEIKPVVDETMDHFLRFHFDEGLPPDWHVKDGIKFPVLQTEIMKGAEYEDILRFACIDHWEESVLHEMEAEQKAEFDARCHEEHCAELSEDLDDVHDGETDSEVPEETDSDCDC